jgi:DNA polymerase
MQKDAREILSSAARQLLAIEELLGSAWIPADQPKLPAYQPAAQADPPDAPTAGPPPGSDLSVEAKAATLDEMDQQEVRGCVRCGLHQGRTKTVFGEGDPDADLVFVGEGPGHDEDVSGRPFVGRAGQLLTRMIHAMGLDRQDVFICNVVKCRPPSNRNPMPEEVEACWGYLMRQLQTIRPRVIVTLGNPATKKLLETTTGITRLRGTWQELPDHGAGLGGIAVMPTFHPSYVLRRYTPEVRGQVWADLQKVMSRLGLDVPEAP